MKIKSLLAKPLASYIYKQTKKMAQNAVADQQQLLLTLVKSAAKTQFYVLTLIK